jgi:RecB family endonuclease NucS
MYRIDRTANRIEPLTVRAFKDLKFEERRHLQEWIAHEPTVLGEDLLIIQKEFNGFSDTGERLDLLALDRQGSLVIIENKLDDAGKDVTWQALKYASYCSTMSTEQIRIVFQQYLDKNGGGSADDLRFFRCRGHHRTQP